MANVIFEEGTQLQASGFTTGDTLLFKTTAPSDVAVSYTPAAGLNIATVTLTVGEQSLTFNADALGNEDSNIVFFAADGQLVIGTSGADTLAVTSDADSALYAFDGADTIDVSGDGNHIVYGGAGADAITVSGGEGNHNIFGDAGDDTIDAADAEGHLNIFGGAGNDSILGGSGNDHIYGQSAAGGTDGNDTIDGGAGNDYIQGNAGEDQLNGGDGRDRINGGADDDTISGDAGNDTINGNKGDDVIDGGAGDDSLRGGAGDDQITGGDGNDVILGDLGDDTITGGVGTDLLTGGEGADVFVFGASDVATTTIAGTKYYETITDFSTDEDIISLTGLTVTEDSLVFQNSGVSFTTVAAALDYVEGVLVTGSAAGSVAAIQVGADTYLFYDTDGEYTTDATIDGIIKLAGVTASDLTEDNFTLPA